MSIWQLTDADVEAVETKMKQGKSFAEIAEELDISVEMVACAARKVPDLHRRQGTWSLLF